MLNTPLLNAAFVLNPFHRDLHEFDGDAVIEFGEYLDSREQNNILKIMYHLLVDIALLRILKNR